MVTVNIEEERRSRGRMKIFTSYYKKLADDPRDLVPVRVSTSAPSWFPWYCEALPQLYPGWELVNGIKSGVITEKEYVEKYKEKLTYISKEEILSTLKKISEDNFNKDVVLLCYENTEKFCHRHLIAE